jgi:small subunit ribosomal protein S6
LVQSVKRKYEGLFLADSAAATSSWEGLLATVNTIMSRAGAEVLSLEKWDDRRLCYPIEGRNRGCYLLSYFNADPTKIKGIERDVQISDDLLRVMILRADQIPDEIQAIPTPAMMAAQQAKEITDRKAENQHGDREAAESEDFVPDLEDGDIDEDIDETV